VGRATQKLNGAVGDPRSSATGAPLGNAMGPRRATETSSRRRHGDELWAHRRNLVLRALKHVVLIGYGVAALFPLTLIVSTSLKTLSNGYSDPFGLFTSFSFTNYSQAWTFGDFSGYLLNSVLLAVPSTIVVVASATMAGYAFARIQFPWRDALFYLVIIGLLIPFFAYMIPLFFELQAIALLNTLVGVDLVLCATCIALGTFFMRAFFSDLPVEIEQAARVDGCTEWQVFYRVMFPFVRTGAFGIGLFVFVQNWNNFLVPLLLLPNGSFRPVTTGLYSWIGRTSDYGAVAAGTVIAIVPVVIVFLLTQRQFIRSFVSGAVKG
jgi:ABC-type glycerol-3-phosphate transport system permease component